MALFSSSLHATAFKLLLLIALTSVFSFMPRCHTQTVSRNSCTMMSSKPLTYAERLQAAQQSKQNSGGAVAQVPKRVVPAAAAVSTRPNVVEQPFDDATYEHLKYVIGASVASSTGSWGVSIDKNIFVI